MLEAQDSFVVWSMTMCGRLLFCNEVVWQTTMSNTITHSQHPLKLSFQALIFPGPCRLSRLIAFDFYVRSLLERNFKEESLPFQQKKSDIGSQCQGIYRPRLTICQYACMNSCMTRWLAGPDIPAACHKHSPAAAAGMSVKSFQKSWLLLL